MPTQQQIEHYRQKHQKVSLFKLKVSAFLGVVTNIITAPLELVKLRSQLISEGRHLHGYGAERGVPAVRIFYEIADSGVGVKGYYIGYDSLFMRGIWGSSWRTFFWCYFYNHFNKDPRRAPHVSMGSLASFLGGFCAGVLTNPIDIVYNRQAADALYPKGYNRNYSSFLHGIQSVHAEGHLFRGAVASGLSLGAVLGSMSYVYDYIKELIYFWLGPTVYLRSAALIPTSFVGTVAYLPFDNAKVRLHTMRSLPNGKLPYDGVFDCLSKILNYECQMKKLSNVYALYNGFSAAWLKMYMALWIGVYFTDYTFQNNYKEGELWESSNYYYGPQRGYIPHEPDNNFAINLLKTGGMNAPTITTKISRDKNVFISI